ncbi:dynein heavy chain [Angomonas deanei]|uniref:Uncharacterized protein n=1 Tax=Angomonas deanei TaxID=59799 RepID=A0A7G2CI25_9TRYP|nr:dynein heavy chain [Angomonas deanei]CAD2218707.1 hypothetical protein, conserved [Angomonas deanei]|eukprot:EPY39333.1 dynein heavy chain [Angomonas deanei]
MVNSLQVFQQPTYREEDLSKMFTSSTQHGAMSLSKKRKAPPAKLEPLHTAGDTGAASHAHEETQSMAASRIPRFVKTTSNSPNEFAYMVMRPRGIRDPYNPYDLQVVPHKDINPNHYFTVSAAGVTQFIDGAAEFIELSTWERECKIFNQISELEVFRDYKKWRSFMLWRALVRRQAMVSCGNFLKSNLLHIHPNLSGTLQSVRKICLDFLSNNDLYQASTETQTLEGYCATLKSHLDREKERIEKMMKTIREKIEQACKAAMLAAQGEREQQNVQREDDNKRNKKKKVLDTRDTGAQQQPSYIEMGQRMATCKRLTAFIKLCDYILITCLTKLAEKALENMKIDLQYPKERTAAVVEQPAAGKEKNAKKKEEVAFTGTIFKGEIVFNEEERTIEIVPPHSSVIESVEDIIRDYVRTVGGVPRLVSMDTFKVYTDQAQENANEVSGGPEVAEMVVSESVYKTNVSSIRESIAATFSDVDDYVHTFEPFREMYLTNEALDTDLLLEKPQTLEFFRAKLSEYKAQMEAISSKIPDHKDVALVTVFTESFREFMIPSPVSCLEGFHKVLPVIVHRQNERLLEELQTVTTYLSATPKTVEHYVEYLKYYKEF